MLDSRQAFKFGFLLRCASEGLTPEQTRDRISTGIQKLAEDRGVFSTVGKLLTRATELGGLGLVASIVGGGTVGLLGAKMTNGSADPEEYKKQELIQNLHLLAQQARDRRQTRSQLRLQGASASPPKGL